MGAARTLVAGGRLDDVIRQAAALPAPRQSRALLALQMGLHLNSDYRDAIRVGELLHEREKAWDIAAYFVAVDWAAIGSTAEALTWLIRAADAGFSAVSALDKDARFDALRATPGFADVRHRMLVNPPRRSDTAHGGLLWTGVRR
jgi:hypothetical protein